MRFGSQAQKADSRMYSWVKSAWHSVPTITSLGWFSLFLKTNLGAGEVIIIVSLKIAPEVKEQQQNKTKKNRNESYYNTGIGIISKLIGDTQFL